MSAGLLGVCQLSRLTYSRKQSKPSWVSWVSSACVIATNRVRSSRGCSSAGAGEGSDAATAGHGRRGRRSSAVLRNGYTRRSVRVAFTISNVAAAAFGSWSIARKNESHCCKRAAQMVPFEPRGIPRGVGVHWGAKMARRPSGSPAGLAHSHTARAGTVRESMAAAEARWGPRGGRWREVYVARCMTGGSDQAGAVGRVLLHRRPAHER